MLKRNPNYHGTRPHHLGESVPRGGRQGEEREGDRGGRGGLSQRLESLREHWNGWSRHSTARAAPPRGPAASGTSSTRGCRRTTSPSTRTGRSSRDGGCARRSTTRSTAGRSRGSAASACGERPPTSSCRRECPASAMRTSIRSPPISPRPGGSLGTWGARRLLHLSSPGCRQKAQVVQANLNAIGIDLQVKSFPIGVMFDRISQKGRALRCRPRRLGRRLPGSGELPQRSCPPSGQRQPLSYFDDPSYNRRLAAAARLSGPRRYSAYGRARCRPGTQGGSVRSSVGTTPSRTSSPRAWAARSTSRSTASTSPHSASGRRARGRALSARRRAAALVVADRAHPLRGGHCRGEQEQEGAERGEHEERNRNRVGVARAEVVDRLPVRRA